ncbi:SMI1/KNR4 family protein [Streptomyces sp. NPDC090106]|uniref:SMI1/KNR4 family protein n=1 Tax=Streptomyces sp. NPDC090106 TaxID=3365946 RepID=UPI003817D71D
MDKGLGLLQDLLVTDDDLILAVREKVADRGLPEPASPADVRAVEQLVGHPMPELLRRLYLEVSNGGFGSWDAVSLTDTGDWFSDCADIAETYRDFSERDCPLPSGIVPLMDRGCAMWTLIDFRTADGQIWDWDPASCCTDHALAPLDQPLAQWLADWLRDTASDSSSPHREPTGRDRTAH